MLFWLLAAGCSTMLPPGHPRAALVPTDRRGGHDLLPVPALVELFDDGLGHQRGKLTDGTEVVRFDLRRLPDAPSRPLVLVVPILAGGASLTRLIADRMFCQGFDVAFCERVAEALRPPQRGADLNELFRRTVRHQRLLLAWLRRSEAPPQALHILGLSMGGIISTVVAALEPDLAGVAICLSGGDLADLVATSSERRVEQWRQWRREIDGIGNEGLRFELQQLLDFEPLRFAAAVPTERVLFVSAAFDSVVPRRNQDLLWEALGRPLRLDLPLGHYTAALAIDSVLRAIAAHFHGRPPSGPTAGSG